MGLNYEIVYKNGKENVVAKGLSKFSSPNEDLEQFYEISGYNASVVTLSWI